MDTPLPVSQCARLKWSHKVNVEHPSMNNSPLFFNQQRLGGSIAITQGSDFKLTVFGFQGLTRITIAVIRVRPW